MVLVHLQWIELLQWFPDGASRNQLSSLMMGSMKLGVYAIEDIDELTFGQRVQ